MLSFHFKFCWWYLYCSRDRQEEDSSLSFPLLLPLALNLSPCLSDISSLSLFLSLLVSLSLFHFDLHPYCLPLLLLLAFFLAHCFTSSLLSIPFQILYSLPLSFLLSLTSSLTPLTGKGDLNYIGKWQTASGVPCTVLEYFKKQTFTQESINVLEAVQKRFTGMLKA